MRSDGNELLDGDVQCVCIECGAFCDLEDKDANAINTEPLPSNATPNNKWENPFTKETQRKIWI